MTRPAVNILFALTIFLGAFLLFIVQPLLGKYILPWFGGTPAVWTTCMLFFQVMLLLGYAYAHALIEYVPPKGQMIVHLLLLVVALLVPIVPGANWIPQDAGNPTGRILGMLTTSIGLPYLALAATGPLLQSWFGRLWPMRSPYRLYALSNVASLLALLSYPVVVEPTLTRPAQALFWRCTFFCFTILCAVVAVISTKAAVASNDEASEIERAANRPWSDLSLWVLLPACASALLLAITNKICQDVAVIPLLWVIPLAIYLITFIISFDSPRWYVRVVFIPLMFIALAAVCVLMLQNDAQRPRIVWQIAIYCAALFACCMVCHGELYRRRPDPLRLTGFYLLIAFGGAIGGVLVAVAAPLIFRGYFELHIALFVAAVLTAVAVRSTVTRQYPLLFAGMCLAIVALGAVLLVNATSVLKDATVIDRNRNFYGVLTVYDVQTTDPLQRHRILQHGGVTHGLQFADPVRQRIPTAYYGPLSGVGVMFRNLPRERPIRVAAVGLGVGTIAAYAQEGDLFRFYEINPAVLNMAGAWFAYLFNSLGKTETVFGDARISLQREEDQNYDVLVLDAFSGDAIPVHLLTKECFELYLHHLNPQGIIAVHISNQNLDLAPVVQKAAEHFRLASAYIVSIKRPGLGEYDARWMLLSKSEAWINSPPIRAASSTLEPTRKSVRLWTDDDANLFQILN